MFVQKTLSGSGQVFDNSSPLWGPRQTGLIPVPPLYLHRTLYLHKEKIPVYTHDMSSPVLATKLFIPPPPPKVLQRPRLMERMNEGLHRKVTLVSAAAGFGKTTLISEWLAETGLPVAWVSLDEEHNDPSRFLIYLISAVQKLAPDTCTGVLHSLMSPQPPPADTAVIRVINELSQVSLRFVLVLDDYHMLEALPVDRVLTFLVENLPPSLHLVIASREDPPLPLPRLQGKRSAGRDTGCGAPLSSGGS